MTGLNVSLIDAIQAMPKFGVLKLGDEPERPLVCVDEVIAIIKGDAATRKDAADCKNSLESSPTPKQPTSGVDEKALLAAKEAYEKAMGETPWKHGLTKAIQAYEAAKAPATQQPDVTLLDNGILRVNADYQPKAGEVWEVSLPNAPSELLLIEKLESLRIRTAKSIKPEPERMLDACIAIVRQHHADHLCPTCQSGIKGDCGFHCEVGDSADASKEQQDEAFPMGAIENGRAFIDRLEAHYRFEDEGRSLASNAEWDELKRCFEYMADFLISLSMRESSNDSVPFAASTEMLTAGDRAIGRTMRWPNHNERAKEVWESMLKAHATGALGAAPKTDIEGQTETTRPGVGE